MPENKFEDEVAAAALELASAFAAHCTKYNIPRDRVFDGVAVDSGYQSISSYTQGYTAGRYFEKGRLTQLLGLDGSKLQQEK